MKIKILVPIYNDWQSALKLLDEIDNNISDLDHEISVIIVNDASTHDRQDEQKDFKNIYSIKIQYVWDQDFDKEIQFVTGDEWKAGNLSYHLKSRPKWEGFNNKEILDNSSQFICVGDVCLGRY